MTALPPPDDMYAALLRRDAAFEGIFFVAVHTTGIFCRPTCPARKPARCNVSFFPSTAAATAAGYRPCKRCSPLELDGQTPSWLGELMSSLERDPERRWSDGDLRAIGLQPRRVQRWFKAHHGMTFHGYQRARRLGTGLERLAAGGEILDTAFASGYESASGFHDAVKRLVGDTPRRARSSRVVQVTRVLTPLGPMVLGVCAEALCLLEFADRRMLETQLKRVSRAFDAVVVPGDSEVARATREELAAYFDGTLRSFSVPLSTAGTPFQERVWEELRAIPYGTTRSYGEQARRLARATAVRAVARANGDNRISIVIPCHRVVGADGKLTGYGGGLWRKRWLLDLERRHAETAPTRSNTRAVKAEGGGSSLSAVAR